MASTQGNTDIWSAETFTASSTHADSSSQDISTGYGAGLSGRILNGATAPTVELQLQIYISQDNIRFDAFGGPIVGSLDNAGERSFSEYFPMGQCQYWKVGPIQNNTVQDVTVDLDGNNVTAVA